MEARCLLATFVVNSNGGELDSFPEDGICDTAHNPLADPPIPPSGICTFRAAAEQAFALGGNHRIEFAIPAGPGVVPVIDDNVAVGSGAIDVDATTQPAGRVEFRGTLFVLGDSSTVRGFVFNEGGHIHLGATNTTIAGNTFGLNLAGTARAQSSGKGIEIYGNNNTIGGASAADRNVIAAGGNGILIQGDGNLIIGNYLGTDSSGNVIDPDGIPNSGDELGNNVGIHIQSGTGNVLGGTTEAERNIISGNVTGIVIDPFPGQVTSGNWIRGNYIGTNTSGTALLPNTSAGIFIDDSSHNIIGGADEALPNIIAGSPVGIRMFPTTQRNQIVGNFIGTNAAGADLGNAIGIELQFTPHNVLVDNIIAHNDLGVTMVGSAARNNLLAANHIGVDVSGTVALGNNVGILINDGPANCIGGPLPYNIDAANHCATPSAGQSVVGNLISGNTAQGVRIANANATGNLVLANVIGGSSSDPPLPLGNAFAGLRIENAPGNFIGVLPEQAALPLDPASLPYANTIAFNGASGVVVTGNTSTRNVIRGNRIYRNFGIGIDLAGDRVTPPDPLDADAGPNGLLNFPTLTVQQELLDDSAILAGTLAAVPNSTIWLDFYAVDMAGAEKFEHGIGGQRLIGSQPVLVDASGYASFVTTEGQLLPLSPTEIITAQAYDSEGNTSEFSHPAQDFIAGGQQIRTPILFVPGFFASFPQSASFNPNNQEYLNFILNMGVNPQNLAPDPILLAYDDILKTLRNAGYVDKRDLWVAVNDWRLPIGPAGDSTQRDGIISGVTAERDPNNPSDQRIVITDERFEYGLDYIGYWLRQAAEDWYVRYGQPLTAVHLMGHSMGGLQSRNYIQSTAYGEAFTSPKRTDGGKLVLPQVKQLNMLAVPNQGAAATFAPWYDNFANDDAYRLVLSKVVEQAWEKIKAGHVIRLAGAVHIQKSDFISLLDDDPNPDRVIADKIAFVRKYTAGMGDLLPTYSPTIDALRAGDSHAAQATNGFLLDLNASLDPLVLRVAWPKALFGTSITTATEVSQFIGPKIRTRSIGFLKIDEKLDTIGPFDTAVNNREPLADEKWYEPTNGSFGDGTVPIDSLEGLFPELSGVDVYRYCQAGACNTELRPLDTPTAHSVKHTSFPGNRDVQLLLVRQFGHTISPAQISTGSERGAVGSAGNALVPALRYRILTDPVEAVIVDAQGRLLGFTHATGPLEEIPGSVHFGGEDGLGWIFDEPVAGPLSLELTGLGGSYFVEFESDNGVETVGVSLRGELGLGETLSVPLPVALLLTATEDDVFHVLPNSPLAALDVLANDTLNPNLALTLAPASAPSAGGTVQVVGGQLRYQPAAGFRGVETFAYILSDGQGGESRAQVTVVVGAPPVAVADGLLSVAEDESLVILPLANDTSDSPLDPSTLVITTPPLHGTLGVNLTTGAIVYAPAANYFGPDEFRYRVRDSSGLLANEATVQLEVDDVIDPWRNDALPLDVNGDGTVDPLDVLLVEIFLNEVGSGPLPAPTIGHAPPPFVDVNGDGEATPLDSLLIVNFLNAREANEEPPPELAPPALAPGGYVCDGASLAGRALAADDYWAAFYWEDYFAARRKRTSAR